MTLEARMKQFQAAIEAKGDKPMFFYLNASVYLKYVGSSEEYGWKTFDDRHGCWVQAFADPFPEDRVEVFASSGPEGNSYSYDFSWSTDEVKRWYIAPWEGITGDPEMFTLEVTK